MSFKVEVKADDTGKWVSNAIRFATPEEAHDYAHHLAARWTMVIEARVVESDDPVRNRLTGKGVVVVMMVLLMLVPDARAQQRTVYGADGRVQQRVQTDSTGAATIYGADGRVQGRASTDSAGRTTVYGADGRTTGTISAPSGRSK